MLTKQPFQKGQGGLLAIAFVVLIAIVITGASISQFQNSSAVRTVVTKQSLQSFYAAEAGIQEALATRMLPRSNHYNFSGSSKNYYSRSGSVFANPDPIGGDRNLMAYYRYIILGGNSAKDENGNYYASNNLNPSGVPRLLANDMISENSPFLVISNGLTCLSNGNKSLALPDQLVLGINPTCGVGSTLDSITLVSEVYLEQEHDFATSQPNDKLMQQQIFKDESNITLPKGAFVPGLGWRNAGSSINFDTVWNFSRPGSSNRHPLVLERIVFYNFVDNTIYLNEALPNRNRIQISTPVPAKSAIRLYFRGAIDYKTISPLENDKNLTGCQGANSNNCNIRVLSGTTANGNGGTVYTGNIIVPMLPESTQVLLLPPLENTLPAGQTQTIRVDTRQMTDFNNIAGRRNYRIVFETI
ncbi:MAG: hypothetical protein AAGI66_08465 [Cyanobacteria bacterium P01_H01_bin.74]